MLFRSLEELEDVQSTRGSEVGIVRRGTAMVVMFGEDESEELAACDQVMMRERSR